MMRSRKFAIAGIILLIVGLIGITWGIEPSTGTASELIPSGDYYYEWQTTGTVMGGHLSGDFSTTGVVRFFVMTPDQFEQYASTGSASNSLYNSTSSSGSFSVDFGSQSDLYMVAQHGSGNTEAQQVTLHYTITGIWILYLLAGIVLAVAGLALLLMGQRTRRKEVLAPPSVGAGQQPATDVQFYGPPKNP